MPPNEGLIYCREDWGSAFCVTKTIEFSFSMILFLIILHDFVVRLAREREFNFFTLICIEMLIALIANLIFTLDHNIVFLMYVEAYAYDIYFTTIVYQVSRRLLVVIKNSNHFKFYHYGIHGLLVFFVLFLTITFITRLAIPYKSCEEIWFLVINMFGISLSVLMVIAGKFHNRFQEKKVEGISEKNTKSPMSNIWKWIIFNIICQFVGFLRSFIYIVSSIPCEFTQNASANSWIGLFFELFSFHVGIIATILFYRHKHRDEQLEIDIQAYASTIRNRLGTGNSKSIEMSDTVNKQERSNTQQQEDLYERDIRTLRGISEQREKEYYDDQRLTIRMFLEEGGVSARGGHNLEKFPVELSRSREPNF